MGLFSWDCLACKHSVRHRGACRTESRWMSYAIYLGANGNVVRGEYDGYGRIGEIESLGDQSGMFAFYHQACHKAVGEPKYTLPSPYARDQGHFVGEYDPPEPKSMADLMPMLERANAEEEKRVRHNDFSKKLRMLTADLACVCEVRGYFGMIPVLVGERVWVRCSARKCNKLHTLDDSIQQQIRALHKEYGEEIPPDEEINADLADMRMMTRKVENLKVEMLERNKIASEHRDPDMDTYYAELLDEAEEALNAELRRLGRK